MSQNLSIINSKPGGTQSKLNLTAVGFVGPVGPRTIMRILPVIVGTGGALTFNDVATAGAVATANEVITIPFGSLAVGVPVVVEFPFANGIYVSAVPSGGCQYSISYI